MGRETRTYDFRGSDRDGRLYLILQETDRHEAIIVCERLAGMFSTVLKLKGGEISYEPAVFPEDGESVEALLGRVSVTSG
ncbi:MAG: hypothetical protein JRH05_11490 [Deltaproteobacteria bacterium]|nr:hypothetical protein [Deltaproteobacteria bacterium]